MVPGEGINSILNERFQRGKEKSGFRQERAKADHYVLPLGGALWWRSGGNRRYREGGSTPSDFGPPDTS